jgi:acyl-CoA reductase-like NAD-dependent aldehyde dehydrogenase
VSALAVLEASAATIKRVTLELGGKSAGIVFPDVDLHVTASNIMSVLALGLFGQVCTSQTRALVHRSVHDAFVEAARRVAESARFVRPTIFISVRNDVRIAREEVFRPVLVVMLSLSETQSS